MKKKFASAILCMAMLFAMLPGTALAEDSSLTTASAATGDSVTVQSPSSTSSELTNYTIKVEHMTHGSIRPSTQTATPNTIVMLTVTPETDYELADLKVVDANGNEVEVTADRDKYTFTMPSRNITVSATFKAVEKPLGNPFKDVKTRDYYYDAVLWALENGITAGTSTTTFSPNGNCNRAQVVTFLWRAAGTTMPTNRTNPFTDLERFEYYYNGVLWAVENGIAAGTSETTFSPKATCTRGQIVTFLWRAAGSPEPTGNENPFTDVVENSYYYDAVLWAVENGIASGTTETTFAPNDTCTRAQIVTFLYRANQQTSSENA